MPSTRTWPSIFKIIESQKTSLPDIAHRSVMRRSRTGSSTLIHAVAKLDVHNPMSSLAYLFKLRQSVTEPSMCIDLNPHIVRHPYSKNDLQTSIVVIYPAIFSSNVWVEKCGRNNTLLAPGTKFSLFDLRKNQISRKHAMPSHLDLHPHKSKKDTESCFFAIEFHNSVPEEASGF